jgi:glycosyltransferase involved in cell wall biosynthesis
MPSSRIKVMKFISYFGVGGTERQFLYFTKGLDRSRFDLSIGCMSRTGGFFHDVEALGVPITEYAANSLYSLGTLQSQWKLAGDIRREGIQLLHAYGFYSTVFAIPAATIGRHCVRIASVRDIGAFTDRAQLRTRTLAIVCRWADCVLSNSHAVRGWLIKQGVRGTNIHVIPNGITIPTLRTAGDGFPIRDELKIDHHVPVIAMVSRLIRSKGTEYFIEAAKGVAERIPAARFLIVGDNEFLPSHMTELRNRAAALTVDGRLIFTGQRSDVPKILREVDMCVLPTLTESFSNSLLEAMANGLPVIATNVGGNPELIDDGKTGILVPPRDAAALEHAIVRLLESRDLARELGETAREKVIRQFSLDVVLRQTEELYMSLIERRGLSVPLAAAIDRARPL